LQLYKLCRMFSENNVIVAVVRAKPGERFQFQFSERVVLQSAGTTRWSRQSEYLGATTKRIDLSVPFARWTNDFQITMDAPEGYVFSDHRVVLTPPGQGSNAESESEMEQLLHERIPGKPQYQAAGRGRVRAHVNIVNGSFADPSANIQIALENREVPYGSSLIALNVSVLTAAAIVVLLLVSRAAPDSFAESSVPALLTGFVSGVSSLTFVLFGKRPPTPLSHLTAVGSALIAIAFALWWIHSRYQAAEQRNDWVASIGGLLLLALAIILVGLNVRAALMSLRDFRLSQDNVAPARSAVGTLLGTAPSSAERGGESSLSSDHATRVSVRNSSQHSSENVEVLVGNGSEFESEIAATLVTRWHQPPKFGANV
jgi:hypothetical protein